MTLSETHVRLLSKGLKFTPTPQSNLQDLEKDIKEFSRRLRLQEKHFKEEDILDDMDTCEMDPPLVRNNTNYNPPPNRNKLLDNCIDTLMKTSQDLDILDIKPTKNNLSHSERKALGELKNNPDIIIKQADKGGAICIMDKEFYASKIQELLQDQNTYKVIENEDRKTTLKIKKLVNKYSHCLKEEEKDFLLRFDSKGSNLYGLPKIHKSKLIKEAIESQNADQIIIKSPDDLKFRPIVAGPVCPTSRLSQLIDCIIKDLPQDTKSYVRDDIHFLSKLERSLPESQQHLLATFDVESLYTNIDHELGIKAIKYWINKLGNKIASRFTEDFICDAIRIVLENNTFHFDNKFYLQIKGTAMGTKMAPTYANLVLAYLEETLYENLRNTFGSDYSKYIESHFLRYLDDCFIVWPTKWNIDDLDKELNHLHPSLHFTKETSEHELPFLDILVLLKDGKIETDVYYKPTDTHQYLYYNSCHPRHTKNSIPYSQARRLCTIIDDDQKRDERLEEMKHFFIERGYPLPLIINGIDRAKSIPKESLRQAKPKTPCNTLPFVFTHNPRNPNMTPIIKSTLDILKTDKRMKKVLTAATYVTSRRQPPNLSSMLTRARFTMTSNTPTGSSSKCGDLRCRTCPFIQEGETINITSTGRDFRIKTHMNCKSQNVLYIITCQGCKLQYVGMTNDRLIARIRVHKQQINDPNYTVLGVSKHIAECSSGKFLVTPFFKISSVKNQGLIKEQYFIDVFRPALNGTR